MRSPLVSHVWRMDTLFFPYLPCNLTRRRLRAVKKERLLFHRTGANNSFTARPCDLCIGIWESWTRQSELASACSVTTATSSCRTPLKWSPIDGAHAHLDRCPRPDPHRPPGLLLSIQRTLSVGSGGDKSNPLNSISDTIGIVVDASLGGPCGRAFLGTGGIVPDSPRRRPPPRIHS